MQIPMISSAPLIVVGPATLSFSAKWPGGKGVMSTAGLSWDGADPTAATLAEVEGSSWTSGDLDVFGNTVFLFGGVNAVQLPACTLTLTLSIPSGTTVTVTASGLELLTV